MKRERCNGPYAADCKDIVVEDLETLLRMLIVRSGEDDAHIDRRFANGVRDFTALFDSRLKNPAPLRASTQQARYLAATHRPALALAALDSALRLSQNVDADEREERADACRSMLAATQMLSEQARLLSRTLRSSLGLAISRLTDQAECHLDRSPLTMSDLAVVRSYAVMHRPLEALARLGAILSRQVIAVAVF